MEKFMFVSELNRLIMPQIWTDSWQMILELKIYNFAAKLTESYKNENKNNKNATKEEKIDCMNWGSGLGRHGPARGICDWLVNLRLIQCSIQKQPQRQVAFLCVLFIFDWQRCQCTLAATSNIDRKTPRPNMKFLYQFISQTVRFDGALRFVIE